MTLVLIHGYPFDHTLWNLVAVKLDEKVKIIAPDLAGFGSSPVLPAEPSLDAMADAIAAILDSEKIESAVIAGMSMGGYVALSFAERYSEKLAGLALVSTQSLADTDETRVARREMIAKVQREGAQAAAAAAIPKLFAPANQSNETFKQFPIEGAAKAGVRGISWALEAMARRPDRTDVLTKLKVPALILHGSEDKFIPVERARQMAQQAPGADYVEISNAGHVLPLESPDEVASALSKLMKRVTTR